MLKQNTCISAYLQKLVFYLATLRPLFYRDNMVNRQTISELPIYVKQYLNIFSLGSNYVEA